jgi:hypothetical protein
MNGVNVSGPLPVITNPSSIRAAFADSRLDTFNPLDKFVFIDLNHCDMTLGFI